MSFLSKIELKQKLKDMGIKVEGNYVKKSDLHKIISKQTGISVEVFVGMNDIETASKIHQLILDHNGDWIATGGNGPNFFAQSVFGSFPTDEDAKKYQEAVKKEFGIALVGKVTDYR